MTAELVRLPARVMERSVRKSEDIVYAGRMKVLGTRVHLAVVADRPDIADQCAGAIVTLSDRRLRQLGFEPEPAA